jgi:predicted esterase
MKMKKTRVVFLCGLFLALGLAQGIFSQSEAEFAFDSYQEFRAHLGKLFQEKKIAEAVQLLEIAIKRFPDHLEANAYNLAFMSGMEKDYETGLKALTYAHDHGVWFGKYVFNADVWKPFQELPEFKNFLKENEAKRLAAQQGSESRYEVFVPEGFQKDKTYPLFIALHGGGENIEVFKPVWTSGKMKAEFVVVYVQSSQKISMHGYNWTEDIEVSKREISRAYKKVIEEYPIDRKKVIVGGFSSGGVASLEIVLQNVFPVKGFVVLCPAKPDSFTLENVRAAQARGVTGTLLTTEMDNRLDSQKEMDEIFRGQGFRCEFIVTPNIGHWYPKDLEQKIDEAVHRIFSQEK